MGVCNVRQVSGNLFAANDFISHDRTIRWPGGLRWQRHGDDTGRGCCTFHQHDEHDWLDND
jgi:hypothetical protein